MVGHLESSTIIHKLFIFVYVWYLLGSLTSTLNQRVIKFTLEGQVRGISFQEMVYTDILLPLLRSSSVLWGTFLVALRKWCVYSIYERILQILEDYHPLVRGSPVSKLASTVKKLRSKYPKISRAQRLY